MTSCQGGGGEGWQEEKWDSPTDHFTEAQSHLPRDKHESTNKRLHHFYPCSRSLRVLCSNPSRLPISSPSRPKPTQPLSTSQSLAAPSFCSRPSELLAMKVPTSGTGLVLLSVWNILHGMDTWPAPSRPSSPCPPMSSYPSQPLITSTLTGNPAPHIPPPSSPLCSPLFTPSDILPISLLRLLKVWPPH